MQKERTSSLIVVFSTVEGEVEGEGGVCQRVLNKFVIG